jgi:hypothetical protein
MEVPTIFFATSISWVCPCSSYNVSLFPRHGSCLLLRPLIPSPVLLSFLRRSCRLEPRSFFPLFYSCCSRRFFPNVLHQGLLLQHFLAGPWLPCSLLRAGMAWRVRQ